MGESEKIPDSLLRLAESDDPGDAAALIDAFHLTAAQRQRLAAVLNDPARVSALLRRAERND